MSDVRDNIFSFLDDWYGRLDDIIEDLKNNGFTVLNATNEFIDVSDENDKEYVLKLGGTEKTITINKIEALDESLILIKEKLSKADIEKDIIDCVGIGFETGHIVYDEFSEFEKDVGPEIEEVNDPDMTVEDAWNFYNELVNMGPGGFYDEYYDKYDFDPSFIAEYGGDDENYDESLIPIKEYRDEEDNQLKENSTIDLNKDKAKSAFESLLSVFNGEDIKFIDEEHNDSFGDYYAHILYNDSYIDFINDIRNNWSKENVPGEGIVFKDYTDFGLKQVSFEYEDNDEEIINRINIYVQYNDANDESTVIKESITDENEKLVFLHLDNIAELASNYDEIDKTTLGTLVRQLEDEIEALNKVYIEMRVGIKRYKL